MLVSIQLNSNRANNINEIISNIEETASNPSEIEVLIHIDDGDKACKSIIESLQKSSKIKLRYIQTNIIKGYKDLWKPLNLLLQHTDPNAYFITNFSDEFRFKTVGWDDTIKKYIGYYDDGIFRIRLSRYRFRNYNDFWECVFAPDSLAFYTKKWMDVVGMWCPCLGPDSWQQLVSFYLINSRRFDHIQYNRDIPEPFVEFYGEGASEGLKGFPAQQRIKDNIELWFETVSHEMQEKARYAAAKLQTNIILFHAKRQENLGNNLHNNRLPGVFNNKNFKEISCRENNSKKMIEFFYQNKPFYQIKYKLDKLHFFIINNARKMKYFYYAGGGNCVAKKSLFSHINMFLRQKNFKKISKNTHINLRKPKHYKKSIVGGILWPTMKVLLLTALSVVKLTQTEKYYRFIKYKWRTLKKTKIWNNKKPSSAWPLIKIIYLFK